MKAILEKIKNFFDVNSVEFKGFILLLSCIILVGVFKISLLEFQTDDSIPKLEPINTKKIVEFGPLAVKVKIGLYIKNMPVFDIIKNDFLVDAIVWFEFNPDEIMLETVEKFSLDNGNIRYKSTPDIKIEGDKAFVKYNVVFDFKSDLEYYKFPLEDHRVSIIITNDFVTPDEMYFVVDQSSFQVKPLVFTTNWKILDTSIDSGYLKLPLDRQDFSKSAQNPKALFVINFIKASIRKIMIIFIPLFSAAYLSLFSFVMNISNIVGKFSLAISAVTALLGYRFVIEQIMPPVGYFTTTDSIFIFLLLFAFICFIFQLLITRQYMIAHETKKSEYDKKSKLLDPNYLESINGYTFLGMVFLLIATVAYLILK